jgi:hypothetical protein
MASTLKANILKTVIALAIGAILGVIGYASFKWHRTALHDEDRVKAQIEERVKPLEKRIEDLEKKAK